MAEEHGDWQRVGDQVEQLGRRLREMFERASERSAPDRQQAEDALETFGRSVSSALDSVGDAFRDPSFTRQARQAADSLLAALATEVQSRRDALAEQPVEPFTPAELPAGDDPAASAAGADEPASPADPAG